MSQSQKFGLGIAGALIIALTLNSGRVVLGQKEANPQQAEKEGVAEAGKFVDLTDAERAIAQSIGNKAAQLEMMNLRWEALKREMRRYTDLQTDIAFQLNARPSGLSAREIEEMHKDLESRLEFVQVKTERLSKQFDSLAGDLATQRIELHLLAKKNGIPDLATHPAADPSLAAIEQSLKAIEAKLASPPEKAK